MHDNPPTSFLCQIITPIFSIHMSLRKITILILKSCMIGPHNFTEDLRLYLLNKVWKGISVYEASFLCVVAV